MIIFLQINHFPNSVSADTWIPENNSGLPESPLAFSVSCVEVDFCIATGRKGGYYIWNGSTWQTFSISANIEIHSVSCFSASPRRCKAVGDERNETGFDNNAVILNWVNSAWTVERPPVATEYLSNISCVSESFCKATGFQLVGRVGIGKVPKGIILNWDGTKWTEEFSLITSDDYYTGIFGLHCFSINFCKATGSLGIYNWNGTKWTQDSSGVSGQNAVYCIDFSFCKAVGDSLYEWNGIKWQEENNNGVFFGFLQDVSCVSRTLCKAVGNEGYIINWDGQKWSRDRFPGETYTRLYGISCLNKSAFFCKAVGLDNFLTLTSTPTTPLPPSNFKYFIPLIRNSKK